MCDFEYDRSLDNEDRTAPDVARCPSCGHKFLSEELVDGECFGCRVWNAAEVLQNTLSPGHQPSRADKLAALALLREGVERFAKVIEREGLEPQFPKIVQLPAPRSFGGAHEVANG